MYPRGRGRRGIRRRSTRPSAAANVLDVAISTSSAPRLVVVGYVMIYATLSLADSRAYDRNDTSTFNNVRLTTVLT